MSRFLQILPELSKGRGRRGRGKSEKKKNRVSSSSRGPEETEVKEEVKNSRRSQEKSERGGASKEGRG